MKLETTTFNGPFAEEIKKYVEEKKLVSQKVENYIYPLKSFDTFSKNYHKELHFLTKSVIHDWLKLRSNEKKSNQATRAHIIRGFSKYMNMRNKQNYILPTGIYTCGSKYNAYIYSEKEIYAIFNRIDSLVEIQSNNQRKNYSSQIIFRLLYMCGLRISEALNIKLKNFDKKQKILTIQNSKNNKDRIIPINEQLNVLIINYINKFHVISNENTYLFENKNNKPYTRRAIYGRLKTILKKCNIYSIGNGQNLHAFRHTYAVHCLKKWVLEGKDLMAYMPILQTFLGHDSYKETAYYLKFTSDVYPNITKDVENKYNNLIPEMEELV